MIDNLKFRPAEVLKTRYSKKGSWKVIEQGITKANHNERTTLDRRKLKKLCEGADISLYISDLKALDRYLQNFNEGLSEKPIFTKQENILDSFAERDDIACFIAAKYSTMLRTEGVSRWDMRSLILLNKNKPHNLMMDFQDVPLGDSIDQTETDEWENKLKNGNALIAIGSPLACPASEYLMAQMVGKIPYKKVPFNPKKRLPFYFIFPDIKESFCPSTFFITKKEAKLLLEDKKEEIDSISGDQRGIIVGNDFYSCKRMGKSYALLIAQRRQPEGQIVLCLCGSYGPSTYGLAKVITQGGITKKVPKMKPGKFQPIMITVVETNTEPRNSRNDAPSSEEHQENRWLSGERVARSPKLFYHGNGRWQEE